MFIIIILLLNDQCFLFFYLMYINVFLFYNNLLKSYNSIQLHTIIIRIRQFIFKSVNIFTLINLAQNCCRRIFFFFGANEK